MEDTIRFNLTESLRSTAVDLSRVATGLAGLVTDGEIEKQADVLDHIAECASDGAAILRELLNRRGRAPLPRRLALDDGHRPPDSQSPASTRYG